MNAHYTAADLDAALTSLPLEQGDILFLHSNIGFFGRASGVTNSGALCEMFFDALMRRIGSCGTVVVPTFTYSFPQKRVFNPDTAASEMGLFAEWTRQHPDAKRSCDPSYSVSAIGEKAELLTRNMPENSFSPDGFFGRFLDENGVVLNLNFDAGSTFLHYLERELNVPYRFDKTFEGFIEQGGVRRLVKNTIYVRYMSDESTAPAFEPFNNLAIEQGHFHTRSLGRGQIGAIHSTACQELLAATLPDRPWILTKAEVNGVIPDLLPEAVYQST